MTAVTAPAAARRPRLLAVGASVVAAGIFALAAAAHLRNSCFEQDTPYLRLCPDDGEEPERVREEMREHIARNPGDANAWTKLLVNEPRETAMTVLPGATLTAPNNHNVTRWRALQSLEAGRSDEGISMLVQILRYRQSPETAGILAQVAARREGLELLKPHLATGDQWLPKVLAASRTLKLPPGDMLPLVAAAIGQNVLPAVDRQYYMRSLKASGDWLDAYGLWVAMHKDHVPLLYNAGFDQRLQLDGFDWEYTWAPRSRAGVLIDQEPIARRGLVLEVEFTGRRFPVPVVRQYLFAPPGAYRLRGEYMVSKLRSEEGLAWSVQCTAARKVAGRSPALKDTGGAWRPMEFEFNVPADCGAVISLQLEPAGAYEAATGIKGRAAFDAFSLVRTTGSE